MVKISFQPTGFDPTVQLGEKHLLITCGPLLYKRTQLDNVINITSWLDMHTAHATSGTIDL